MAATTLTIQDVSRTGLQATYGSANTDGSYVPNNGDVVLHLKNTSGGAITVTAKVQAKIGGLSAAADQTVQVPATSGDIMFGPFPPNLFNDQYGRVLITFSGVSSLTVAALRLPS